MRGAIQNTFIEQECGIYAHLQSLVCHYPLFVLIPMQAVSTLTKNASTNWNLFLPTLKAIPRDMLSL